MSSELAGAVRQGKPTYRFLILDVLTTFVGSWMTVREVTAQVERLRGSFDQRSFNRAWQIIAADIRDFGWEHLEYQLIEDGVIRWNAIKQISRMRATSRDAIDYLRRAA